MSKHTIKGFIVYETWNGETEGKLRFQEYEAIRSGSTYTQVPVCEHTLTFDLPEGFDPRPGQIAALQNKKTKLRAEMTAAIAAIDTQISKLQALEFSGSEA